MKIPDPEYYIGSIFRLDPTKGTCDIALLNNQGRIYDVPILGTESTGLSGSVSLASSLEEQSTVLLMRICHKWYVLCTIPVENNGQPGTAVSSTNTGTGGDNATTYGRNAGSGPTYMAGRSVDSLSGDKRLVADGGSTLLLGKEGLVVLKASDLAQIVMGAYKNFVRIMSREFELFTDFGTIRFTGGGKEGVTGMAIMGGGNFADESSTIEPAYPVHMYMGEVPWDVNGRFAMQVDSPKGDQHIRTEIDINGNRETYASKAIAERSLFKKTVVEDSEEHHVLKSQYVAVGMGNIPPSDEKDLRDSCKPLSELKEMPVGDGSAQMGDGDSFCEIANNDSVKIGGQQTTQVANNKTLVVGGDKKDDTAGNLRVITTGNKTEQAANIDETTGTKTLNASMLILNLGSLTINGSSGNLTLNSPINITYTPPASDTSTEPATPSDTQPSSGN